MSEPCRACGAAMAEDQRYCLNCGERRGAPRVDFRQHLTAAENEPASGTPNGAALPPAPERPAADGPGEEPRRQRDYAPLAAAGGIAVLGIMLLIGVLIGRGSGDGGSTAAQPSVVTVATEGAATGDAETGGEEKAGKKKSTGGGKAKAKKQGGAADGGSGDTGNAEVASEAQLKELQEQSPEEYSESSAKLPDEIATPGEPPPTDNKTPGGGSGGTTIE